MINIRAATPWDTEAIAVVKRATWPHQDVSEYHIAVALSQPNQHTAVATINNQLVGYMSCFSTQDINQQWRWELDELAVHPHFRRKGIATALVHNGIHAGLRRKVRFTRALIQVENFNSQRAFIANRLISDHHVYSLFVCNTPGDYNLFLPQTLHCVEVRTFSYGGIWLEGEVTTEALSAAPGLLHDLDRHIIGALLPSENKELHEAAQDAEFVYIDNYHYWTLSQ